VTSISMSSTTGSAEAPQKWTVLGIWYGGEAWPVGVICGHHEVVGGPTGFADHSLWAASVTAPNGSVAEQRAVAQMQTSAVAAARAVTSRTDGIATGPWVCPDGHRPDNHPVTAPALPPPADPPGAVAAAEGMAR
jgi:hypothetical protein